MNKSIIFIVTMFILTSVFVAAQIDQQTLLSSRAICGNGIRDAFEPCDRSSNASDSDLCPSIGKVLKIAMVCDPRNDQCTCQPRRYIICGDKHTKGNELCDPPDVDYCPQVGALFGKKLECNPKSCLCKAADGEIVLPKVDETNLTKSLCSNHQVDDKEECDPPGRLCTTGTTAGVCSEDCKCKPLEDETEENATEAVPVEQTVPPEESNDEVFESVPEDSGLSDTTYTVLLIVLVVLFLCGLAVASFFLYKRSQVAEFEAHPDKTDEEFFKKE